jgi:hypothetical protein
VKTKDEKNARGFESRLLPALLEAVKERRDSISAQEESVPHHDRRSLLQRRWPAIAVVAGAAVLLAIVIPVVSNDPLGGALAVTRHGDTLYLRVEDASADPEAMTNDLRAAGLDAKVELIPVGPSSVGFWVDVVNDSTTGSNDPRIVDLLRQLSPEEYEGTDQAGIPRARVLEVPADFSSRITLRVGRAAKDGEMWLMAHERDVPDETQPGGILYCLRDLDPPEADGVLRELGYEVDWSYSRSPSYGESVSEPPAGKVIVYGELLGPDTLKVETVDPDSEMAEHAVQERATGGQSC